VVSAGQAAAAASVLTGVFALSWPSSSAVHRETIALGEVSCVDGLDYESAALAADTVYQAFDRPGRGVRFEVGKHTFVRYALDLGEMDRCLIRLSASPRPGWTMLVDRAGRISTRNVDAYARRRLARPPIPSSLLFPRHHPPPLAVDPANWSGRHALAAEPGRSLVVTSSEWPEGEGPPLGETVRLLVPVEDDGPLRVRIGVVAPEGAQVRWSIAGHPPTDVVLGPGPSILELAAPQAQPGWSLVEVHETSGRPAALEWLETGGGVE
jgi:hypothetical protein